ncbi:TIGR03557 family F420-dependent LLM class oxidoreductase [Nocardioides sp. JQ2195]|uniref:TIGR03557 family F420-dependent LLM class oxidoreductase n=1 Tax=Nocardioides sp. JQ2195 TaxID=2592334 RepID=UPI00143EB0AB|nr:TIGR03557 family F420-dependent LLM class oxidoreductase [Nocardioides sp. JQ2195]QIX27262.1 TIGR03557 family F420-dependent LLM class oxidoreductase [Nocardioides sp. JQ2195]
MTSFGYTLMTEQAGPRSLVDHAVGAESHGFDFAVMSDHYSPWLESQGHAPYAWSVLGAVAQATSELPLMTYVTCPTMRYHPAVVAQKAATLQLLSRGRFTLGLGSGENLNEHTVGAGWPHVSTRHAMLEEALEIIRALLDGGLVDYDGEHFQVDAARIWDLPDDGVPIGLAVGGPAVIERCAALADHLVATEPKPELVDAWNATDGAHVIGNGTRAVGQIPISWDPSSVEAATERAHDQFRWFAGGWSVNSDLPTTAGFEGASKYVRPGDVAESIPCGPDLDAIVDAVRPFWEAGFTDVALVQIGGDTQEAFLEQAAEPLLEKLREEAPDRPWAREPISS